MRIRIDLDESHNETSVTIHAAEWTEELEQLMQLLKQQTGQKTGPKRLIAENDDSSFVIEPTEVDYIYAEDRKVFAMISREQVEIKRKLYELEEQLSSFNFIRFSKSVIGNVDRIERFEVAFNGNLCVFFKSGNKEYVSRKYVKPLREKLTGG